MKNQGLPLSWSINVIISAGCDAWTPEWNGTPNTLALPGPLDSACNPANLLEILAAAPCVDATNVTICRFLSDSQFVSAEDVDIC